MNCTQLHTIVEIESWDLVCLLMNNWASEASPTLGCSIEISGDWASEASPTLGCSIEISRDIYMSVCMSVCMYVCRMSNHVESRESNTRMLKVSIGR